MAALAGLTAGNQRTARRKGNSGRHKGGNRRPERALSRCVIDFPWPPFGAAFFR